MKKPFYRLEELMLQKYGEKNLVVGHSLVGRWLSYEMKQLYTYEDIERICSVESAHELSLTIKELTALKTLFGLQSVADLFTQVTDFNLK